MKDYKHSCYHLHGLHGLHDRSCDAVPSPCATQTPRAEPSMPLSQTDGDSWIPTLTKRDSNLPDLLWVSTTSVSVGKREKHFKHSNYSNSVMANSIISPCHFFLSLLLLPAPSSPSPTQPSRASSWHPLHTPRLSVLSRCRKRSNSALALGLYATEAAQPIMKHQKFYIKWISVYQSSLWIFVCVCANWCLIAFSWSQDVCVAESTDKHDGFERIQSQRARAQILHGDIPHLHTHICRQESCTLQLRSQMHIQLIKALKSHLEVSHVERHWHLSVSVAALLPDHSYSRLPCWRTEEQIMIFTSLHWMFKSFL